MRYMNEHIDVLGTTYHIQYRTIAEDKHLENADGYCDYTSKNIVIKSENDAELEDFEWLQRKSLRHEILHAFLAESGLQSNFQHAEEYGHDETMIDWFAIQFPKIGKIFEQLNILN